jgi:hypothetical protein
VHHVQCAVADTMWRLLLQGWLHTRACVVQQALHHRASLGQVPHPRTAQCH